MITQLLASSKVRYIIVGGTCFVVDTSIALGLINILHMNTYIAGSISFWIGLILNFILNKLWSFKVPDNTGRHLIAYSLITLANFIGGLIIIFLLAQIGLGIVAAKLLTYTLAPFINYFAYRNFVFVSASSKNNQ